MIKIFALDNNYSYNIVILTVFNYLHSVSTSLSSNEKASNCDNVIPGEVAHDRDPAHP